MIWYSTVRYVVNVVTTSQGSALGSLATEAGDKKGWSGGGVSRRPSARLEQVLGAKNRQIKDLQYQARAASSSGGS